jgi:UDP-N-acetylmuramate dehydrogenase
VTPLSTDTSLELNARLEPNAQLGTWFGIGGRADLLAKPESADELLHCLERDPDLRVLGDGANLLVDDDGIGGLVVSLQTPGFGELQIDDATGHVLVGAGARLPQLITETVRRGLGGLQTLAGIPATLGGAVVMNAGGAFGQIADSVLRVHAVDRAGREHSIDRAKIDFDYRQSRLNHLILTAVELQLTPGDPATLREDLKRCMAYKKGTQPLKADSAGCVFKNPTLTSEIDAVGDAGAFVSAGLLLDRAGCKGLSVGGATVSEHHANFIVTTPDARARDVMDLATIAQQRVLDTFGVPLHREVVFWSRDRGDR